MKTYSPALIALPVLFWSSASALAQTVTVTTAADLIDINPQTGTITDLPGPDGKVSFSEAMIATNNTPGHQTIAFNIPQSEWILQFILPGRAVINSTVGFYFRAYETVTIDGTTQTAFTGDTNPNGNEVVIYGNELYLNADNCTLLGFDSTSVSVTESLGLIEGNTGTMNITLFHGSGSVVKNNEVGTIKIDRSHNNTIVGNTTSRIRVWGSGSGQPALNNRIGGPNLADRNFITGYGTWNSDGYPSGTTVELFDTTGTLIENNWIGTTPDGLAQGNQASIIGVGFSGTNNNTIIRDNRIAGILGHGMGPHAAGQLYGWAILLSGGGSGIEILGNTIGLDANDQPLLGSVWGIDVGVPVTNPWNGSQVRIGGLQPGEGNVIAGHILNGVSVGRNVSQVRIQGNSMFDNGWSGIDLLEQNAAGYGVTANDPLDADSGGNGLQNYPEIQLVSLQGTALRIVGSLNSIPLSQFTLEFFSSPACDASGFGEGQIVLGTTSVSTNSAGNATFDFTLPIVVPANWVVTSTATLEPLGATSEHSACVTVLGPNAGQAFCFGDGTGAACPCGNTGQPGNGCANGAFAQGANLSATGAASIGGDSLILRAVNSPSANVGMFFQGDSSVAGGLGAAFGDGLQCAGGNIRRLDIVVASTQGAANSMSSISVSGAALPGQALNYQWWYRDPGASPCGNGFNLSNGLQIVWMP